ncbi:MAG: serine/threonine protein kinase [Planctomycetes bacterium]|nr:serine/threonine protein kinase [Planctomycetota bacterium]
MLEAGKRIGGLMIHEMVGRGAMGEVYRAEQINLQRQVAVKRIAAHLTDQAGVLARFAREARLVATLNSPHVLQVYEFGPYDDHLGHTHTLLVMEWIEGGTSIRQCMTDNIGMPWPLVARIFEHSCLGLAIAHDHHIVHRDIKPDNLLLSPLGQVKIGDFGLANASDSSALTADGAIIGTPNYLCPEACNGEEVTICGDIYSLGATVFHLLTGCPLYTASTTIAL